jgi:glutamyl-Q tRNA(Asp) synthetase
VRIEDIDAGRCRPALEAAILEDLAWLGLRWETPVLRQSTRRAAYRETLGRLDAMGLLYPCACTRADIAAALGAPQEEVETPPVYPGTCRGAARDRFAGQDVALRLDLARALERAGGAPAFTELGAGPEGQTGEIAPDASRMLARLGDVALGRKDIGVSYHLCVVVDDAAQGVTHVTRGCDLFEATALHVLVQLLLGLPTPHYRHHRLIRDAEGRRLAKRDDARSLASLRADGATPEDIRRRVGL